MKHRHHPPTTRRGRLRVVLAALAALGAGLVVAAATPAAPASAAQEIINPAFSFNAIYDQDFGNGGDVPMPSCGSANITGDYGHAQWTMKTSLGPNSVIFPGREWTVTFELLADHLDYHPWNYNDGPDPLIVQMVPTGPVERVQIVPELPAGMAQHDVYQGDSFVGPLNPIQTWGYAFDNNSEPKLDGILIETSDGSDLRLTIRMRATGPGVVALPKLQISGWDSTPKAASVSCEVPIGWTWGVVAYDPPLVKSESVKTDASYAALLPDEVDDANWGTHGIEIDVLANDDDANSVGGVGNTDQVRLESWALNSTNGGSVNCGTLAPNPADEAFADLSIGPCYYSPATNFEGIDTFTYTVRQQSDGSTTDGVVKVNVVRNRRPLTATAENIFVTDLNDVIVDVSGYSNDPDGDPLTCLTDLVSGPAPALGTVTMHADCTFDWHPTGGTGGLSFTYRVCDTHPLLADHGPNTTKSGAYATSDLTATTSRRCTDADVELTVGSVLVLPPVGAPDLEQVDAGYAGDGIGAYTIEYPVFQNDYDLNGPDGEAGLEGLLILESPDPATVGTASVVGERIRFTPVDGFTGAVKIPYRVCEDPALQDDPYPDLGFCGGGILTVDVVPNLPPVAADDFAVAVAPSGTIVDRDLGANDSEPDGEGIVCEPALLNVDPAFITSATLGADCLLDVDPVDGVVGATSLTYTVCDDHTLLFPKWPADPFGDDGRAPGDVASRCSTAEVDILIIQPLVIDPEGVPQIEPGPEGPPDDVDPTLPPDTTTPPDTTAPGVPVTPPTTGPIEIPNPGELPRTGGGSGGIVVLGAVLLVAGLATVQLARRRRTT